MIRFKSEIFKCVLDLIQKKMYIKYKIQFKRIIYKEVHNLPQEYLHIYEVRSETNAGGKIS
jgi:hypothetical protein